ncbi:helix-turn-helix domain-containing protein [Enterobacter kobei]|uniref:helix-turn-helix domain-containing protein n=1 Tax=Enterobacter cloacae complex TaxID=354276 RepID=UPI002235EEC6|nr:helix-turn-helix domain-containing protein [Enterobacter hormaechei]MCW4941888.1 helix-turn-helix domain-containing protein [Enterobacter hormaechei subsp. xiangfangensis]MDL5463444.1 helix-turn-helix domain-containing protein [Enterobacter hormaechei]HBK4725033.1 helix-turn-helix domain-containing protein [Enterobacter hormaechei subsp. steigerwaltii]HBK4820338.1 helix-turn-helix domain-containing protein [Enterobacter hormaechei subsp. steigerwaltii]
MVTSSEDVREILERILISYGVSTRQAYADLVGIPIGTVNNWLKRNSLPGDYLVQCAVDTGADVIWLKKGNLANASFGDGQPSGLSGIALSEKIEASGGKIVLRRILDAYGFKLQKELGDHLNIPSGTMSAWIRREHFPGEVVIVCSLETGVSLLWLATGIGSMYETNPEANQNSLLSTDIKQIAKFSIHTGSLINNGAWYCDESLIDPSVKNPALVEKNSLRWLVDLEAKNIANGRWLIDVDGTCDVYDIARLPGNKLVVKNDSSQFECLANEVTCVGMVFLTLSKSI